MNWEKTLISLALVATIGLLPLVGYAAESKKALDKDKFNILSEKLAKKYKGSLKINLDNAVNKNAVLDKCDSLEEAEQKIEAFEKVIAQLENSTNREVKSSSEIAPMTLGSMSASAWTPLPTGTFVWFDVTMQYTYLYGKAPGSTYNQNYFSAGNDMTLRLRGFYLMTDIITVGSPSYSIQNSAGGIATYMSGSQIYYYRYGIEVLGVPVYYTTANKTCTISGPCPGSGTGDVVLSVG